MQPSDNSDKTSGSDKRRLLEATYPTLALRAIIAMLTIYADMER